MRAKTKWIVLGTGVLFAGAAFVLTSEPEPPYKFLKKFKNVERKTTEDGRRFVIVEGDYDEVVKAARAELVSPTTFSYVTTGSYSFNEATTQYSSFNSSDGIVTICSDLSGKACRISTDGFMTPEMGDPDNKPGFCAISYTRPPSLFDRVLVWMRSFFGGSKPTSPGPVKPTIPAIVLPSTPFPTRPPGARQLSPARPEQKQRQTPGGNVIPVGLEYRSPRPRL